MSTCHHLPVSAAALALLGMLGACAPTLDWREVRPEGPGLVALFPCKPTTDARMVTIDGHAVRMLLTACRAGDATWAVAAADMADPSWVTPALENLRVASEANLGGTALVLGSMKVEGMTPNPRAERVRIGGKLPDGQSVNQESAFFAKGTWVFQATVLGATRDAEPVNNFFANLKLSS